MQKITTFMKWWYKFFPPKLVWDEKSLNRMHELMIDQMMFGSKINIGHDPAMDGEDKTVFMYVEGKNITVIPSDKRIKNNQ